MAQNGESGQFLLDAVRERKPNWQPDFAMQCTLNWAHALSFEIAQEHGEGPAAQLHSCRAYFAKTVRARNPAQLRSGHLFEPLFHSLTFATTLATMKSAGP